MRVALDATPLSLPAGGLRRYTEELARALSSCFPEDEYVLVSDQPFETDLPLKRGDPPSNIIERRWWLYGLEREMRRRGADLFHGTNFQVPLARARPSVVTIHDLSPWRAAEPGRVRMRSAAAMRFGFATMIITVSQAVRREVIERFRLRPERVVAVPLAAAANLRRVERRPADPYFLYVGDATARKNLDTIAAAWREVRGSCCVGLVIAGCRPRLEHRPGVEILGRVPEERLAELYSGAVAVLYPSLYEGFGLPVLEAMQCGAPVIASKDAAVMEVSGGAALHVDATDVRGWADAMRVAATSAEWRAERQDRGLARAAEFSWESTARGTRKVYDEAARRFRA